MSSESSFPKDPTTVIPFSRIIVLIPVIVAPVSTSGNCGVCFLLHSRVREWGGLLSLEGSLLTTNRVLKTIVLAMMTLIEVSSCTQKVAQI
jgi:hypothetical protein